MEVYNFHFFCPLLNIMNHISFIDCFFETPVHTCVNDFILRTKELSTYHMVSKYGFKSLYEEAKPRAYVILGSASHVNQRLDWHLELAKFIDTKLRQNIPVLGICFGHQLMADFYGSKVDYIDETQVTRKEPRKLTIDSPFYGIPKDESFTLAYCHSQVIKELSNQFTSIAHSDDFENEIIKHNTLPFIGLQAHPEASKNFLANEAKVDEKLLLKTKNDGDRFLDYFISALK